MHWETVNRLLLLGIEKYIVSFHIWNEQPPDLIYHLRLKDGTKQSVIGQFNLPEIWKINQWV